MYVCESQSQSNYWPKDAIQMTAYHEWMRLAAAADYNVIWIPLSDTVCFVVWQTERECCLLVLNLVSSTLPCIRQPRQTVLHLIISPSFVHGSWSHHCVVAYLCSHLLLLPKP